MKTFLFYDLETTGLNKCFDQVVQFAAIRTDRNLNEISRHEIKVALRPDVIPSPYASITHRVSLKDIQGATCEFDAAVQIHELLNEPGTISVGYNTMGFDDEFLRFMFYRNMLAPYQHQFYNGCGRLDLLPIAAVYYLYKPNVIKWPKLDGKATLKLEHLSSENSLAQGQAHDAMVDVEATVALAKKFALEQKMWEYITLGFDKKVEEAYLKKLPTIPDLEPASYAMAIAIQIQRGAGAQYQSVVMSIGTSYSYSNQSLWLILDREPFEGITADSIPELSWVIRKKDGSDILLPPLERYTEKWSQERRVLIQKNIDWIKNNPEMFKTVVEYHRSYKYAEVDGVDPDALLYTKGFIERSDDELSYVFRNSDLERKQQVAGTFSQAHINELSFRVLFRNFSSELNDTLKDRCSAFIEGQLGDETGQKVDFRGEKRYTKQKALDDIVTIEKEMALDDQQQALLVELKEYICGV